MAYGDSPLAGLGGLGGGGGEGMPGGGANQADQGRAVDDAPDLPPQFANNAGENYATGERIYPLVLTDDDEVVGKVHLDRTGERFQIDPDRMNILSRRIWNVTLDTKHVQNLESRRIFELIPKPPEYPIAPPESGQIYAANWARIVSMGGWTGDPEKMPKFEKMTDWSTPDDSMLKGIYPTKFVEGHKDPAHFALDPVYLYFTLDSPVFYVQNAISWTDPKTGQQHPVKDNDVVWKIEGKEVHRGWHMSLGALDATVDLLPNPATDDSGNQLDPIPVMVPKRLTVEFHNKAGMIQKEIKYAAIDSDDAGTLTGFDEEETFAGTFGGSFVVNEEMRNVEFIENKDKYGPRYIYFRINWAGIGEHKNRHGKLKDETTRIWVDDVEFLRHDTLAVHGAKTNKYKGSIDWYNSEFAKGSLRYGYGDYSSDEEPWNFGWKDFFWSGGRKSADGEAQDYEKAESWDHFPLEGKFKSVELIDMKGGRPSAFDQPVYDYERNDNRWCAIYRIEKPPGPFSLRVRHEHNVGGLSGNKYSRIFDKTITVEAQDFTEDTGKYQSHVDLGVIKVDYEDIEN